MSDRTVTVTVTNNGKVTATADLTVEEYLWLVAGPVWDTLDDGHRAHNLREQDPERALELDAFVADLEALG